MKRHRVIQWATGSIGCMAIRAIAQRPKLLELAGCYVSSDAKRGRDAGEIAGIAPLGVRATNRIDDILAIDADCVHYAPLHPDHDAVCRLLERGFDVVTPSFYVHPAATPPGLRDRLARACERGSSTLHGTGIHPGFSGDRLALTFASLAQSVRQIITEEVADLSPHPSRAMMFDGLGFGAEPAHVRANPPAVLRTMDEFFRQSQVLVAQSLGETPDGFESAHDVAVATERIEVRSGTIERGRVAAQQFEWRTLVRGHPLVVFRGFWKMTDALDPGWKFSTLKYSVTIEGEPSVRCGFEPGSTFVGTPDPAFDTGKAGRLWTAMLGVNAIPAVCEAKPGFLTVADLPPARVLPPVIVR